MMPPRHSFDCAILRPLLRRAWTDVRAAQIVEFAVSLPLLVVFVVGIFDFSRRVSVKQKLMNAAREAARVAASDPANDLGGSASPSGVPASISDANQVVDNYLLSEKINDCGLGESRPRMSAASCGVPPPPAAAPGAGSRLRLTGAA